MTIHGSTDVTVAMTIAPVHGDGWFASKAGTVHSSWTGVAGNHAEAGDLFLYGTDDKWHEIANETDLNAYLPLVGGTMAAGAHITAVAAPVNNGHLTNKKYVDDQDALNLPLAGGVMGSAAHIAAPAAPTIDTHLANKKYVDDNGLRRAIDVSAGGADAGKLIKLDCLRAPRHYNAARLQPYARRAAWIQPWHPRLALQTVTCIS